MFDEIVNGLDNFRKITDDFSIKEIAPRIFCTDGARLSVQASRNHYSTPRSDFGPYTHVEIGFPSVPPPDSWAEYFDGDWETDDRTESVYCNVPIELVREYIKSHGGEE